MGTQTAESGFRLAGKSSALKPCRYPDRLVIKQGGATVPYPVRCGWCPPCIQTKIRALTGAIAAHMLVCARIDFLTLTYASNSSVEAAVSAQIRNVKHIQLFQKSLRQRERRALRTWNKNNPSEMVDASRSYIKFQVVNEIGSRGAKQSHWHLLVFYESHFPIDSDLIAEGDSALTCPKAKRVWYPKHKVGPLDPKRINAQNPDLLDYTLPDKKGWKPDGSGVPWNQQWDLWPWGAVTVKCVSHDTFHLKNGVPTLKRPDDLAAAVRYVCKYAFKTFNVAENLSSELAAKEYYRQSALLHSANRPRVTRTCSRGIGHDFARARGRKYARHGVAFKDTFYQINGMRVLRSPESIHKFQASLASRGVSGVDAETLTDDRIWFEMRGAMREACFDAYYRTRCKRLGCEPKITEMGDPYIKSLMRKETSQFNEFLNSHAAIMARRVQTTVSRDMALLPDRLTPVHVFEHDGQNRLLDGTRLDGETLQVTYRPAIDRLNERRAEIKKLTRNYEKARGASGRVKELKKLLSKTPLGDLETEALYARRPRFERERFKHSEDARRIEALRLKLRTEIEQGDKAAAEKLAWLNEYCQVFERDAFELPRHDLHCDGIGPKILWKWINTSDDFKFAQVREKLLGKYCHVKSFGSEKRVVTTNKGIVAIQRQVFSENRAIFECPETGKYLSAKGFRRWATRVAQTPEEIRRALDGTLPNKSPTDADALFGGSEPLI